MSLSRSDDLREDEDSRTDSSDVLPEVETDAQETVVDFPSISLQPPPHHAFGEDEAAAVATSEHAVEEVSAACAELSAAPPATTPSDTASRQPAGSSPLLVKSPSSGGLIATGPNDAMSRSKHAAG